ncbi:TetR-like C-terminal domain-containing protein [Schaalia vaccimaxillae]|nr:TetR-like C-terminal domain-containing protein [Schaalia vaccimaxillae]
MMVVIVDELSEGIAIDEDDRAFIIDHFTLSVLGVLRGSFGRPSRGEGE